MPVHRETLEEEATHVTDEARMLLPGVQAVLGFQLAAVFNQRFQDLRSGEQFLHLTAFLLMALAMGLVMAPAAYHRQVERGSVSRHFVDLSSALLTLALFPLVAGLDLDTYLIARLILVDEEVAMFVAGGVSMTLLCFGSAATKDWSTAGRVLKCLATPRRVAVASAAPFTGRLRRRRSRFGSPLLGGNAIDIAALRPEGGGRPWKST